MNWLVRQLKDAPDAVRVEAFVAHGLGSSAAELLKVVRENPAALLTEPGKELRSFRVAISTPLGAKRGRGRGSFIDSVLDAVDAFYSDVVQDLRAWSASPPRLRADGDRAMVEEQDVATPLVSTPLSSQDGAESADGAHDPAPVPQTPAGADEPGADADEHHHSHVVPAGSATGIEGSDPG